jgi:hypothetical protein
VTFSVSPVKSVATLLKIGEMTANSGRVTVVPSSLTDESMMEFAPFALGSLFVVSAVEVVLPPPPPRHHLRASSQFQQRCR